MGGSQTRSGLVSHFARTNNISDCAAKEGNQDRGVKMFGIPLALVLLKRVGNHTHFPIIAYAVLVIAQFTLNVLAVRALRLEDTADPSSKAKRKGAKHN